MSEVLKIAESLQDTQAAIAQVEKIIAQGSQLPSILATLKSLRKRQQDLENQFAKQTNAEHIDVCHYRLFPDRAEYGRPTLRAFTKTLLDFQTLFTQVYSAIKTGQPKKTSHIAVDAAEETSLGFAYSFTGSLGAVLTLPNERLLLLETDIDRAIRAVFELAKAQDADTVARYAKELGVAPIRTLYTWVSDQVVSGLSSQIEWKREQETKTALLAQLPELETLKQVIESVSDEQTETLTLTGLLLGIDVAPGGTFHLEVEETGDIRGKISKEISGQEKPYEVPHVYTAKLIKTTKIFYSTEKESTSYVLQSLS